MLVAALGTAVAAAGLSAPAFAQGEGRTPGQTVVERPRPEVDALGIRAGGFMLYPSLGVSEEYNDNIFATSGNAADDFITVANPKALVESNWNNHALSFFGSGRIGRYAEHGDEDYNDFTLGTDGRVDITRDTAATAGITYLDTHEDRSSPDDVRGTTPTPYSILNPKVGLSHRFGRFLLNVDGNLRRFTFGNVENAAGATIDNGDRDRDEWQGTSRLGYEFLPGYQAFLRGSVNTHRYDRSFDRNGFQRDSDGYEIDGGTAIDFTDLIVGNVFAGFSSQNYQDPRLPTISGVGFGGDVTWSVTRLTTIKGLISRTIQDTTLGGSAGFFATETGVSVDHELLRDLLVGVNADYINDDYQGISRNDDNIGAGAYVTYLMNRYLHLSLRYHYFDRSSNVSSADFTRNTIMISAVAQP